MYGYWITHRGLVSCKSPRHRCRGLDRLLRISWPCIAWHTGLWVRRRDRRIRVDRRRRDGGCLYRRDGGRRHRNICDIGGCRRYRLRFLLRRWGSVFRRLGSGYLFFFHFLILNRRRNSKRRSGRLLLDSRLAKQGNECIYFAAQSVFHGKSPKAI